MIPAYNICAGNGSLINQRSQNSTLLNEAAGTESLIATWCFEYGMPEDEKDISDDGRCER